VMLSGDKVVGLREPARRRRSWEYVPLGGRHLSGGGIRLSAVRIGK
jgi:hypothetical protein